MTSNPHYEADPKAIDEKHENGKKVITVRPRGLNIVWGRDDRYWNVPTADDKPAELLQVCWLEVTGSVDTDPTKRYEVRFNVSLTPDAFGWGSSPLYAMAKRGKNGKFSWTKDPLTNVNGSPKGITTVVLPADMENQGPKLDSSRLYFGLYEVWSGKWKGGLRIHDVIIQEL